MEFRDLKRQYEVLKGRMDKAVMEVLEGCAFIGGRQVMELEEELADYVGVKYCVTCANGTDALTMALMSFGIGKGDACFVPDFTFFATGEAVAKEGATPVFVDVCEDTFNMDPDCLEQAIQEVIRQGRLKPRLVIPVDLFGQPADYPKIRSIAVQYNLEILEDGAQGFGGGIGGKRSCSFGDISTTSFFPAKPLGCYGDGGAVFTDDAQTANYLRSIRVHGMGRTKYENERVGINSRLDTIQAAVLKVKLDAFKAYELRQVNEAANIYTTLLSNYIETPKVRSNTYSSWAQYSVRLKNREERSALRQYLQGKGIPSMIYYPIPMHRQKAFDNSGENCDPKRVTESLCETILQIPIHPYLSENDSLRIAESIIRFLSERPVS